MKICVLGNSHVAAIKIAYDLMLETSNLPRMTFFADRGPKITKMKAIDGVLKPENSDTELQAAIEFTSGGLKEIDPNSYDKILVIGLCVGVSPLVRMVDQPISTGARNCAVRDYWRAAALPRLLRKLRSVTDAPILYGLTPLIAAEEKNSRNADAYAKMIQLSESLFFDKMNVSLVGQPISSIVNGYNTRLKYSRGSIRLHTDRNDTLVQHTERERRHMNLAYGELWLNNFLKDVC